MNIGTKVVFDAGYSPIFSSLASAFTVSPNMQFCLCRLLHSLELSSCSNKNLKNVLKVLSCSEVLYVIHCARKKDALCLRS